MDMQWLDWLRPHLETVTTVGFIAVAAWVSGMAAKRAIRAGLSRTGLDDLAGNLLGRSAQIAIYAVALVSMLGTLGVDTTSLIAALGAAGLAVGLALRDTLSNLAAGLILALNGAFKQGDFIEANGLLGTVLSVDLMSTELKTTDARKIVVPNGTLISSNIVNYSTYPVRRLEFLITISYSSDSQLAERLIYETLVNTSFCHADPEPIVGTDALGDFGQTLMTRVWVDADQLIPGKMQLLADIKQAFDTHGVEFVGPRLEIQAVR